MNATHRPNMKINTLDPARTLQHMRRSQLDRDREREEEAIEVLARIVVIGIALTFLALVWWM